ncbi:hypothetical protein IKF76_00635 [Candidatus Saccharibacteria bacterium]|nr:hypothetical protein [Candidatus Saccharibacteria bacterium]
MNGLYIAVGATDANVERAGLEVGAVRARSNLALFLIYWGPVLNVVFFGGGCAEVAGGDVNDVLWNAELLPNFFFYT